MKLEFQEDLLKFLVQKSESKKYIQILEADVFELDTHYTVFGLLKNFVQKYNSLPSLGNLLEHFDRELKQKSKNQNFEDIVPQIEATIREAFAPFKGNSDQIKEVIIEEYQKKLLKDLFVAEAGNIKTATSDTIKEIQRKITKIVSVAEGDDEDANNKGTFALADFATAKKTIINGTPTYLRALNRMTSTKGFYSPQLVILMGAPKSFKTGTLLNLAVGLVRNGERVYYVDCENGQDRIKDRFYQAMLEATWEEYAGGELDETLEEMVGRFNVMGGDFRADFFPAHTKSVSDVEARLDEIQEETGWTPTVVLWDYPDLMKPTDYRIKEKRLQIQGVYFDIIRCQKKRNIWGIGLSQVSKDAVGKAVIDMKGFAEDFGKAANCHAAFALCRTDEEREAGLMRIVPVVQRDGVAPSSHAVCYVTVDEARMCVKEINRDEASKIMLNYEKKNPKSKETKTKAFRPKKIEDE